MNKVAAAASGCVRRVLRAAGAWAWVALSATAFSQPAVRPQLVVPAAVSQAADAGQPVDVLVLLDDSPERRVEQSSSPAAPPLHLASATEYSQRLVVRQALLDNLKLTVRNDVADADLVVVTAYPDLPVMHVRLNSAAALKRLADHARVLSIDEVRYVRPVLAQSLPLVRQPQAAQSGFAGAGTTVAVLDTGVDYTQAAFGSCSTPGGACKVAVALDFGVNDGSLDDNGHGTNVAGIVLGVAPGARIAALDVFGLAGTASSIDILSAINWCVANKASFNIAALNMSLGGGQHFSALPPTDAVGVALQSAINAGITIVVASGNDAFTSSMNWPAAYSNVLSVGALYDANVGSNTWGGGTCTDFSSTANQITCFSNSASFLGMLAPGALITAAGITQGGTSQASPHVAGAAAVLKAAFPSDSVVSIMNRLKLGPLTTDPRNGISKPRLDLVTSLAGAGGTSTVTLGASSYSVTEGTASLVIPITRSSTSGSASVAYATANGTATAGSDYTARTGTATFASGVGAVNISVPITNDTVFESTETFTFSLSSPSGATLGAISTATVSIVDNDPPQTISLAAASYSVNEGTASLVIPIRRSGTAGSASVQYSTMTSSAVGGQDYVIRTGTATFAAGVSTVNIAIQVVNDTLNEGNETFGFTIFSPVGAILGAISTATITIVDNDVPSTVAFGAASYSVTEGTATRLVQIVRSNTSGAASVAYATANGTATAGADYTARSATATFAAGVGTVNISIPITNDTVVEGPETFTVALFNPVGMTLDTAAPTTTTITIVDNDVPSTVALGAATYSVGEGTASILIPITRSNTAGSASVAYATANATATAGSDYTARSGTASFASGVATVSISVPIRNDSVFEGDETFSFSLANPVGMTLSTTGPTTATVTIVENDASPLSRLSVYRFGSGSVASATPGISCGTTCNASFTTATTVTLQATPAAGWSFVNWSGACAGAASTCTVTMSGAKAVTAVFRTGSTLGVAADNPNLPWDSYGHALWVAQASTWLVGGSAPQSGDVADLQSSTVRATVTGPGLLTFRWRTSSEPGWDYLNFGFDGWNQAAISGESGWLQERWFVPEGTHTVFWSYSKDGSLSSGTDAAWIDEVTFTPGTSFSAATTARSLSAGRSLVQRNFGTVLPKP